MNWTRVTKSKPCPICEKPDWCCISEDAANCMRIESNKLCKNGGWLHRIGDSRGDWKPQPERLTKTIRWDLLLKQFAPRNGEVDKAAALLGVTAESLRMLDMGWDGQANSFPMRDSKRNIVGIRLRFPDGKKLAVTGGREGLFIPSMEPQETLYITEGPTDAAALLSIGVFAIGRPSCTGGVDALKIVCNGHRVIVLADNDGPGARGAKTLAVALKAGVITPPEGIKDARQWLGKGMTRKELETPR